jgi:hypothetical protein
MTSSNEVINIIIHLIIKCHHHHYNGSRSKNNRFHPEGLQLSNKLCAEVYNYIHMENRMNHHTCARVRVASRLQPFPNPAKNVHERVYKFPGNATTIYPSAIVPVSRTSQSPLVTCLVTPICDMWFVWVVTRIHYPNERSLITP